MQLESTKKNESQKQEWVYIPAPGRLDAFNFEIAKSEIEEAATKSKQIALDVSGAQFISIPMIKFIHSIARELVKRGGRMALVGPTEKLKRQIRIFASLDPLTIMSHDGWAKLVNTDKEGRA